MNRLTACAVALFVAFSAFAQTKIDVQAPNLVGLEEQFNVTFVIEGSAPSDFSWDAGDDFQLVWGPQKGSVSTYSNTNGHSTKSSQTTYTYILMPKSVGKFSLPAAHATVKGKDIQSDPWGIEVVADSGRQSQQQERQSGSSAAVTGSVSSDDIYLSFDLSKSDVMVGETVTATLKLYQRVNLVGFENVKFPTFNGFWSQETKAPTNLEFHRESVDGKIYNVALIRSWTLVPQQSGNIVIDPTEMVSVINIRVDRPSTGSIFDEFFQNDYQSIRKRLTTDPVTVHVNRLPDGAPSSFGGGVGKFSMTTSLSRDELSVHDAASLEVRVTGNGNISLLNAPKVNFPPDFEVYDVKTSDIPGGKLFEYPFIPRSHGDFVIEPVEYSYYDISSRRYVTLRGDALPLTVLKGSGQTADSTAGVLVPGVQRRDVRNVGSDIRFISTALPSFVPAGTFFAGSLWFWLTLVLILAAAASAYFLLKSAAARRADVVGTKNRGAVKMARKRLLQAEDFLRKDLYTAFYEELHRALLGYVSDKFNMDAADMSKDNISGKLSESGVDKAVADDFVSLLDACEYARYAPGSGNEAMSAHYEKAVVTISLIEAVMKKHKSISAGSAAAVVVLLLSVPSLQAQEPVSASPDSLWTAGVAAYEEGRWSEAVDAWSAIENSGLVSKELYCNLGNAYFKNDDVAHAILNYERALKMDPSYSDARFNLELATSMIQDNIEVVPEFFLTRWMRSLCWLMPSDSWSVLGLVLLALALAMLLLFLLGRDVSARRGGFVAMIVAFVLSLSCLGLAFWQRADYAKEDSAIVTRAVTTVRSSPSDSTAKDLFVLHEGTKVTVIDELGSWLNIELSDGRQGWITASDLEII